MANIGKITQVIGSTFDAEFSDSTCPRSTTRSPPRLMRAATSELCSARFPSTSAADAFVAWRWVPPRVARGADCVDTGGPVSVPVGEETLGRVFNMLGEPSTAAAPVDAKETTFDPSCRSQDRELSTSTEFFETGIKVVDLLTPFVRGGKAGLFGGAGLAKP